MREHRYFVYILANTFHRLYTGVTNDLMVRVKEHKTAKDPNSFTARYGIDRLVYLRTLPVHPRCNPTGGRDQGLVAREEDCAHCGTQPNLARPERRLGCVPQ